MERWSPENVRDKEWAGQTIAEDIETMLQLNIWSNADILVSRGLEGKGRSEFGPGNEGILQNIDKVDIGICLLT